MELAILRLILGVAFVLAPVMTHRFFLRRSRSYRWGHGVSLLLLVVGAAFDLKELSFVWPMFCAWGFWLHLKNVRGSVLSGPTIVSLIPFLFSMISATWFVAGTLDWHLLGYDTRWSYYAAIHGAVLGWIMVGCWAYLAQRNGSCSNGTYLFGAYGCFVLFLLVAFGINGNPGLKKIGVIGLSLLVPGVIGYYAITLPSKSRHSLLCATISLVSLVIAMVMALLNEFWAAMPRSVYGLPSMVVVHGLLNAFVTAPFFVAAIGLEGEPQAKSTLAPE